MKMTAAGVAVAAAVRFGCLVVAIALVWWIGSVGTGRAAASLLSLRSLGCCSRFVSRRRLRRLARRSFAGRMIVKPCWRCCLAATAAERDGVMVLPLAMGRGLMDVDVDALRSFRSDECENRIRSKVGRSEM